MTPFLLTLFAHFFLRILWVLDSTLVAMVATRKGEFMGEG